LGLNTYSYFLIILKNPLSTEFIDLEYTSVQKFALWHWTCDSLMNIEMKLALDKMLTDA
jgi:hypothetical protein